MQESRGAEPGWAHTHLGGPTPSAVLSKEPGLTPPLPKTTRHTEAGVGRCGHSAGSEMGWPLGLWAGQAPHAGIGNLFLPDSDPPPVLPVLNPLRGVAWPHPPLYS